MLRACTESASAIVSIAIERVQPYMESIGGSRGEVVVGGLVWRARSLNSLEVFILCVRSQGCRSSIQLQYRTPIA